MVINENFINQEKTADVADKKRAAADDKIKIACAPGYSIKPGDTSTCWSTNADPITTPKVCDPTLSNPVDQGLMCVGWNTRTAMVNAKAKVCPNGYTLNINETCSKCPTGLLFDSSSNQCMQKYGLAYQINDPPKCSVGYTWDGASTCNPNPILNSNFLGTPPNPCPLGYLDDVLTCKNIWSNQILQKTCDSDKDMIAGLCYNKCPDGYDHMSGIPTMCKNLANSYTI